MLIDISLNELNLLKLIIRHVEKHQSTVLYDLDNQWPILVSLRTKINAQTNHKKEPKLIQVQTQGFQGFWEKVDLNNPTFENMNYEKSTNTGQFCSVCHKECGKEHESEPCDESTNSGGDWWVSDCCAGSCFKGRYSSEGKDYRRNVYLYPKEDYIEYSPYLK